MGDITSKALRELQGAIDGRVERKAPKAAQTVTGTVTGAKAGALRVLVDGAAESTPVETSACDVSVGDSVTCVISDGSMSITGNTTAPATSQKAVNATVAPVVEMAAAASSNAASASKLATTAAAEAAEISETLGQHFWSDDSGAHVTDVAMEDWQTAEAKGFPGVSDKKQYSNILLNSAGMLLRSAKNNLMSITKSAVSFFDGKGNGSSNVVASFGKDGSQIGYSNGLHMTLTSALMRVGDTVADTRIYSHMIQIRRYVDYAWQEVFHVGPDNQSTSGTEVPYIVFGNHSDAKQYGAWSVTEGPDSCAEGSYSHAEGSSMVASDAAYAHAEGNGIVAYGEGTDYAHVEGMNCAVYGTAAHAEGVNTHAGDVEGDSGFTRAYAAHAEGCYTRALGKHSHAQNYGTVAESENQTAIGIYNDNKWSNILEVGIGTSDDARANAVEVAKTGGVSLSSTLDVAGAATLNGGFAHTANSVALTYPGAWLNALYAGMEQLTNVNDIIVGGSAVNIKDGRLVKWGRVRNLWLYWTPKSKITVPATGDISNITIGTLTEGNRPVVACAGQTDNGGIGPGWYTCSYQGVLTLNCLNGTGSSRTIAAGTYAVVLMTYLA